MKKCKMKVKKKLMLGMFLLILIFSFIEINAYSTQLINASEDTYVRQDGQNTNYGDLLNLEFRQSTTRERRVYLKFPLNFSSSAVFYNVSLCLYQTTNGATVSGELYHIYYPYDFDEMKLSWNNQTCGTAFDNSVSCNLSILDSELTSVSNGWVCWNVPKYIIEQNYFRNINLIIRTNNTPEQTQDVFSSRETSNSPYLIINFEDCIENWIAYNTSCGYYNSSWDKKQLYYQDLNSCGTNLTLPSNNGTLYDCDYCVPSFVCSNYTQMCVGNPPTDLICNEVSDETSCCSTTNLTSDCNYTGNVSDFNLYVKGDTFNNASIIVDTYPYVELNVTYPIRLIVPTNNQSDIKLYLTQPNNNLSIFNFTWNGDYYSLNLLFTQEGNYNFLINGTNICSSLTGQVSGTFRVRESFNLTFCGFKNLDNPVSYENDYAYLLAEPVSSRVNYDDTLEQFLTPIGFRIFYRKPVFHAQYLNGCGTIKVFEKNEVYAVRLVDGIMTFPYTFSPPNITKSYGTNIYFGRFAVNNTDSSYNVFLTDRDIKPYRWLFNWIYIILIFICIIGSVVIFFTFPQLPLLSLIFGLGFTAMLTLARIVIFLWKGF